jgi:hypothetical protein
MFAYTRAASPISIRYKRTARDTYMTEKAAIQLYRSC